MAPSSQDAQQPPHRRWQFSLATLFLLVTLVCLVLSRFYPRVYVSAHIQIPAMTAATAPTYSEDVLSDTVVYWVVKHYPQLTEPAGMATPAWFRANVEVRHVRKNILEIRMSGRPGDRDRMRGLVDAIAAEYIDNYSSVTRMTSITMTALFQDKLDEMKASVDQLADEINERNDDDLGVPEEDARAELQASRQVLRAATKRLEEWKALLKQSPQVLHRDSGLDW